MMKILLYAGKSSNFRPFFNTKGEKEKYNTRNIIIQNNKNVKNLSISPPSCLLLAKRDRGKSAMVHNNINTNRGSKPEEKEDTNITRSTFSNLPCYKRDFSREGIA